MVRLLSVAIECLSAAIFIIPAMFILQYIIFKRHNFNKLIAVIIFAFYLAAVFWVVGIPRGDSLTVDLSFNLIPLIDIVSSPAAYIKNTILNIILFVPMGFLLPVIWEEYRSAKTTVLAGLGVSVMIEALQIFTLRLTDIDDLLTNTLGAFLGYYIAKKVSFKFPLKISAGDRNVSVKFEPAIITAVTLLIGFLLTPLVSDAVWEKVLSGSLWERIK